VRQRGAGQLGVEDAPFRLQLLLSGTKFTLYSLCGTFGVRVFYSSMLTKKIRWLLEIYYILSFLLLLIGQIVTIGLIGQETDFHGIA
jgi:hypothetical protein